MTHSKQTRQKPKYWWETGGHVGGWKGTNLHSRLTPATDLAGRLELIRKCAECSIERETMFDVWKISGVQTANVNLFIYINLSLKTDSKKDTLT